MKRFKNYLTLILLLVTANVFAQKYYTTSPGGTWEGSTIWGTTTNGVGSLWSTTTLVNDDQIVIDDDMTLDTDLTIATDIHIIVDATLSISKKLRLTANSTIEFTENGSIQGTGGGNSEKISFGGNWRWSGNDEPVFGPGVMDVNYNGTLPVSLVYFTATPDNDKNVKIAFASASEENNDYYTIERSKDGVQFEILTTIEGAGNSNNEITYSFTDNNPYFGRSYYRLVQTDFDGASETFDVIAVNLSGVSELKIYPNPARQGSEIKIYTGAAAGEEVTVQIYNHAGHLVKSSHVQGNDLVSVNNDLDAGFYMVKIKSGQVAKSVRLIVE